MENIEGVKPTGKAIKKEEMPWSLGKKARVAVAGTILAGILGGGAYEAANDFRDIPIPALHQTREGAPFDINKLDTQTQTLVLGKNARYATPEEIQTIINSPLPDLKIGVRSNDPENLNLPVLRVLPSIDLAQAWRVEVSRKSTSGMPMNLIYSIENPNTDLGITMFEGLNADTVQIFRTGNNSFIEKFYLGKNRYILLDIRGDLTLADIIKDATFIDANHPKNGNWIQDALKETGQEFKISDNPTLYRTTLTAGGKSEIVIIPSYQDGTEGNPEPISPIAQGGIILFYSPTASR